MQYNRCQQTTILTLLQQLHLAQYFATAGEGASKAIFQIASGVGLLLNSD